MGSSPAASLDTTNPGAPPGYVPKETWLQNLAVAIEIIMPSLALIVVLLRAYSRIRSKIFGIGADDYLIFAAMILAIAQGIVAVGYIKFAYIGIHLWEIPPHDPVGPGRWAWVALLIYNPILALVKISVLVFLLRLATTRPAVRITSWILIVFTSALMVAVCFAVLFICQPIQFNWDASTPGGRCVERKSFGASTGALTVFTDFTTLAIPFWIFLSLRMRKKAKIALLAVFGLGIIVTVVGIVRLAVLIRAWYYPKGPDPNFSITYVISSVENNLAIIAACGPALWPLARRVFSDLFSGLGLSRGFQGDIENIQVTKELEGTNPSTQASSRSRCRSVLGRAGQPARGDSG